MEIVVEFFLPPPGGNGANLGGLPKNSKSKEDYDRTEQPVVCRSLAKTSDGWLSRIHSFCFVTDRLFTADGGPL